MGVGYTSLGWGVLLANGIGANPPLVTTGSAGAINVLGKMEQVTAASAVSTMQFTAASAVSATQFIPTSAVVVAGAGGRNRIGS